MITFNFENKRQLRAEILLATVTIFWGATFPLVKDAITLVPVMCFLWIRFLMAAIILGLMAGKKGMSTLDARGVKRGVFLGVLLFLSYAFQTYGLELTSAANAGFITGLNVVWVPLLAGPILKKPPSLGSKYGVLMATIGLFTLTWHWPWQLSPGDGLVVIASFFIALHILGLDSLTEGYDGRALAFVQIATMSVLGLVASLIFEPVTWPREWPPTLISALLITAIFATAYAFWVQTTFQRWTTPTRAALIYTLEPVFGAIFSIWLAGERLTWLAWVGGGLIVSAMLVKLIVDEPEVYVPEVNEALEGGVD
jgi:drug/metabolite transporter (DMT)-like permease